MGSEIIVGKITTFWKLYLSDNLLRDLSAKEVKTLKLNEMYESLDIDSKNGNNY
jgi:hypothetical protein